MNRRRRTRRKHRKLVYNQTKDFDYLRFGSARRCIWCGRSFKKGIRKKTREHVIPKSKGGPNQGNMGASHKECNNRRGVNDTWRPYIEGSNKMPEDQINWLIELDVPIPKYVEEEGQKAICSVQDKQETMGK